MQTKDISDDDSTARYRVVRHPVFGGYIVVDREGTPAAEKRWMFESNAQHEADWLNYGKPA